MNKLKDIIYDKNDLLIALVILLCASFVIYEKIDVIMDYPSSLGAQTLTEQKEVAVDYTGTTEDTDETNASTDQENTDSSSDQDKKAATEDSSKPESNSSDNADNKTQPEKFTLTIDYGATGSQIAQDLVDSGLLNSKQEFYDAVNKAGADTRLQAGSFNIPVGSTPDEIISIITE